MVIEGLIEAEKEWRERGAVGNGKFTGTSNVYFAMKYKIGVVGTIGGYERVVGTVCDKGETYRIRYLCFINSSGAFL